LWSTPW